MSPANAKAAYVSLTPGDLAPRFHRRSTSNPRYAMYRESIAFLQGGDEPPPRPGMEHRSCSQ